MDTSERLEGTRGKGSDKKRIFVEGTSTKVVGETVRPCFRFSGDDGFTMASSEKFVDAEGNFKWQRKANRRISAQFRYEDLRSNTLIIPAR